MARGRMLVALTVGGVGGWCGAQWRRVAEVRTWVLIFSSDQWVAGSLVGPRILYSFDRWIQHLASLTATRSNLNAKTRTLLRPNTSSR